jgi:DNA invertase Pin-like site-specific DNA recombinase
MTENLNPDNLVTTLSRGNVDRPALQRFLTDVQGRRVDCVMVYKVDRLSRSLWMWSTSLQHDCQAKGIQKTSKDPPELC